MIGRSYSTVLSPLIDYLERFFLGRIMVNGPGQKASISLTADGFTQATKYISKSLT